MTMMLGMEALQGVIDMRDAIDLLETSLIHEAAGRTQVSSKFITHFKGGSMRMLFAVDYEAGYCASKAYHNIEGVGVRYLISLYRLEDGVLLALIDGQLITGLRTGAASGVIARKVPISGPVSIGVIGSGYQARMQLESLASVYHVASAAVFSPTADHRERFAHEMSGKLGFPVTTAASAQAVVKNCAVVAAASSARGSEPVLQGDWLKNCRLLCAVGNTRPQFAEADVKCFENAQRVVVDSLHAIEEAGELRQAKKKGALPEAKCATLAQISTGISNIPTKGLIIFKSVGTALQDLALAAHYYELRSNHKELPITHDLASLKRPPGS